jgi:hypothetical protein
MVWPEMVGRRRGEGEEKKKLGVREVREKRRRRKKERKNQGLHGCFDLILVCVFFLKMLGINS